MTWLSNKHLEILKHASVSIIQKVSFYCLMLNGSLFPVPHGKHNALCCHGKEGINCCRVETNNLQLGTKVSCSSWNQNKATMGQLSVRNRQLKNNLTFASFSQFVLILSLEFIYILHEVQCILNTLGHCVTRSSPLTLFAFLPSVPNGNHSIYRIQLRLSGYFIGTFSNHVCSVDYDLTHKTINHRNTPLSSVVWDVDQWPDFIQHRILFDEFRVGMYDFGCNFMTLRWPQ